jgi:hypothetical protein
MALNTYAALKQAAADWLNREDLVQQIPDFIKLAEATLNKVVRSTHMVGTGNVTIDVNVRNGNVPSDMLEPIFVTNSTDDDGTLEQVSIQQLTMLRRARLRATGTPRFFAVVGRKIEVAPTPAAQITFEMSYYKAIPTLVSEGDTNWVLTYEPDLYLYTTLLHAAPFLKDDQRTQLFTSLVARQVAAAVQQQQMIQPDSKSPGASLSSPSDPARPG